MQMQLSTNVVYYTKSRVVVVYIFQDKLWIITKTRNEVVSDFTGSVIKQNLNMFCG